MRCWAIILLLLIGCSVRGATLTNFELRLPLGNYVETGFLAQFCSFDYTNSTTDWETNAYLLEQVNAGVTNEIAFQVISNRAAVAMRVSLSKLSTNKYWLMSGRGATATLANAVRSWTNGNLVGITNGLTGTMVPWNTSLTGHAPIQGLQLATGIWAGTNNLYLQGAHDPDNLGNWATSNLMTRSTSLNFRLIENGPVRWMAELRNAITHPGYTNASPVYPAQAAHTGYITNTVWMYAGEPNVWLRVATDWSHKFWLNLHPQFTWSMSHWAGHIATSTNFGTNYAGTLYDYRYGQAARAWPFTNNYSEVGTTIGGTWPTLNPIAIPYSLYGYDQPYWAIHYEPTGTNAVGMLVCCASTSEGAHVSGWAPWGATNGANRAGGFSVHASYQTPDNRIATNMVFTVAFQSGYVSNEVTTLATGAVDYTNVPPVQWALNKVQFGLDKFIRQEQEFSDPEGGWRGNYVSDANLATLRADIAGSTIRSNYYLASDPSGPTQLIAAWGDSNNIVNVRTTAQGRAETMLRNNNQGWGGTANDYIYYQALYLDQANVPLINEVVRRGTNTQDKVIAKLSASLGTYRAQNKDLIPLGRDSLGMYSGSSWLGLGLQNQQVQGYSLGYEQILSWFTMRDFTNRVSEAIEFYRSIFTNTVNASGAPAEASGTYFLAEMNLPSVGLMQAYQLGTNIYAQEVGVSNFFKWVLDVQTPPEPRFGGRRMLASDGDSIVASESITGIGANLALSNDATFSSEMAAAWVQGRKHHNSFYSTTWAQIMEAWSTNGTPLRSCKRYVDYMDVMRTRHMTAQENWLAHWIGEQKAGHAHSDRGGVTSYALGAPLHCRFGNFYSPLTGSGTYENSVIREADLTNWLSHFGPESSTWTWSTSSTTGGFAGFRYGAFSESLQTGSGGTWLRQVIHAAGDANYPVFFFRDALGGNWVGTNMLAMWNLDTTNAFGVETAGILNPLGTNGMAGITHATSNWTASAVHEFRFTNTTWAGHPDGGINVNVYVYSTNALDWTASRTTHTSSPSNNDDATDFITYNGASFWEVLTHLRTRFKGECWWLFVPYRKGVAPPSIASSFSSGTWTLTSTTNRYEVATNYYAMTNLSTKLVASLGPASVSKHGVSVSGGPTEVFITGQTNTTLSLSGAAGARLIILPSSATNGNPLLAKYGGVIQPIASGANVTLTVR